MSIQHLNDAKTIARTAQQIGAKLPADITSALDHLESITANRAVAPQPGTIARDLGTHLGNPAAMEKALKAAALDLASAEARARLESFLIETCGTRLRKMMGAASTEIATAFGAALVDDLAVLNSTAALLPEWFRPEQAAGLDPATFEAWTQVRDAHARIQAASMALTPLYASAIDQGNAIHFPNTSAAALRYAKPPRFTTAHTAYAFRDALGGRTERVQGLAGRGSTRVEGLFIPSTLAHAGATFEWATPAEVTNRADAIVNGMVREPEPVSAATAAPVIAF